MADVPFGASFGDPRKYIGQSGIGQAVKTGLTAYGMQKSGLTDFLNSLNKPQQPNIPGAVQPFTGISEQGQLPAVPQAPEGMNWGTMMPNPQAPIGAAVPGTPAAPAAAPQPTAPSPQELGMEWLSGKMSSYVNPQAQRDTYQPPAGGYTEKLATGNEYQNMPGYGKLAKAASAMMGFSA